MTLSDWLINTTGILLTYETIVLHIVYEFYKEYPHKAISELEKHSVPAEDDIDCHKHAHM